MGKDNSVAQNSTTTSITVNYSVAQPSGLVAAYSFNEGTGTTVTDISGNNNAGTISGATWTTAGKFGNALAFNGTNARVSIPSSASLNVTTGMTLEAWVMPTAGQSGWRTIMQRQSEAYFLNASNENGPLLPSGGGTFNGQTAWLSGTVANPVNVWTHVALTYNGATLRLYVNGTQVASQARTGSIQTNSNPLWIGGNSPYGEYFLGRIDEVRVYNRALSQTEIQADMNTAVGGTPPANTPPTITNIAAQTINEDTVSAALGFTVGDAETAAGSLTVSGSSSNTTLVSSGNIVFSGSGANRTVTVTPAANQNGTATITVTVSDGQSSTPTNFLLTVNAVNDAPTITSVANQTTSTGTAIGPLSFTVGDLETAAGSLTVSGSSSNTALVPNGSIVFGGSGANRTITVTPAASQTGVATITVTVNDGSLSTPTTFQLTVNAASPSLLAAYSFNEGSGTTVGDVSANNNNGTIVGATWGPQWGQYSTALAFGATNDYVTIPNSASLNIGGNQLTIEFWVKITDMGNDYAILAKPWVAGTMSYPYYQYAVEFDGNGAKTLDFQFSDTNGQLHGSFSMTPPASGWTHVAFAYDGANVKGYLNGIQQFITPETSNIQARNSPLLFGVDGELGQGYIGQLDEVRIYNRALTQAEIQTDMNTPIGGTTPPGNTAPTITAIANQTTTVGAAVGPLGFTVGDAETAAGSLTVSGSSSNTTLVPNGNIVFGGSNANRTVTVTPAPNQAGIANITVTVNDGTLATPTSFQLTVNSGTSDTSPPAISITSPLQSATVASTITISASANDNVGVVGVQFLLDGTSLGAEVVIPPYSISWDTGTTTSGSHNLAARARDAAGNSTTSASVPVTVQSTGSLNIGQWSGVSNWPLVAVHANLLPTGDVLAWDGADQNGAAFIWRPSTNTFTSRNPPDNIFCAGQCLLPDGRMLVVGGHIANFVGIPDANIFNPSTSSWTQVQSMSFGRWYPTAITLPDGRVLVVGGKDGCVDCVAAIPEIYNPATNTWQQLIGAANSLPEYPHLFVISDGRVLVTGSFEEPIATQALDVSQQTWTIIDTVIVDGHSSVMYAPDKFMKSGTSATSDAPFWPAEDSTYVLDMTQAQPSWRETSPMAFRRSYHNLTILPDGNVLATGGNVTTDPYDQTQPVYPAELWSPSTESWTVMAAMTVPRFYHATAVLLPDGRVLVAGGGRFGGGAAEDKLNAQIYSPPYLFKGTRPTIISAPNLISYNSSFSVGTTSATTIAKVSLIPLGSVTHHFNANQRIVTMPFGVAGSTLSVQSPANANLAPPGYYMFFIVDSIGVPSIASIVRLQ